MPRVEVEFQHGVLDSVRGARHARLLVSIRVDSVFVIATHVDVKQVGDGYEDDAIEVGLPAGYDGPWSHSRFSQAAVAYYRNLLESRSRTAHKATCRFDVEETVLDGWSHAVLSENSATSQSGVLLGNASSRILA